MTNGKPTRGRPKNPDSLVDLVCPICEAKFRRFKSLVLRRKNPPTCSYKCARIAAERRAADPKFREVVRDATIRGLRRARRKAVKEKHWSDLPENRGIA